MTESIPEYLKLDHREFRNDGEEHGHKMNAGAFRDDLSTQEVADYYSGWSDTYDNDMFEHGNYFGPIQAAEGLASQYPDSERPTIKVLDIGCGTGLVGQQLYERNFRVIDGLDPAEGMLEKAATKNIYGRLIHDQIDEHRTDIQDNMYDAIAASGTFGPGHIPYKGLEELIRIVKPGGVICLVFRKEYIEAKQYRGGKFDVFVDDLESKGKWQRVFRESVPEYTFGLDGLRYIYKVLPKA